MHSMVHSGKKIVPFLVGVSTALLMAILLVVGTEAAVTVYNPARIPVGVLVDGESVVQVQSGITSIDIPDAEQKINITSLAGGTTIMGVDVNDRDILVLLPEALVGNAPASVRVVPVPGDFGFDFSSRAGEPLAQP